MDPVTVAIEQVGNLLNNVVDGMNQYATDQQKLRGYVAGTANDVLKTNINAQRVPIAIQGLVIVSTVIGSFVFLSKTAK